MRKPNACKHGIAKRLLSTIILAWRIPWTGAWQVTVHGVAKSQTWLRWLSIADWNYNIWRAAIEKRPIDLVNSLWKPWRLEEFLLGKKTLRNYDEVTIFAADWGTIMCLQFYLHYLNLSNWEKAMAPHSSTVAWKIPWTEKPGRLQSMESHRVGHDWSDLAAIFQINLQRGSYFILFMRTLGNRKLYNLPVYRASKLSDLRSKSRSIWPIACNFSSVQNKLMFIRQTNNAIPISFCQCVNGGLQRIYQRCWIANGPLQEEGVLDLSIIRYVYIHHICFEAPPCSWHNMKSDKWYKGDCICNSNSACKTKV